MDTNDLNRRVRFALAIDDNDVIDCYRLSGYSASLQQVESWRIKQGEPGYVACPADAIHAMLDGVVIQRRGPREPESGSSAKKVASDAVAVGKAAREHKAAGHTSEPAGQVDNNAILKQIRIALSLKTDDVLSLINGAGGKLSKGELNALFRNPSARNYRRCGDQVVRWLLSALASARQE